MYYGDDEFGSYTRMTAKLSRDRRKDTTLDYLARAEKGGRAEFFWQKVRRGVPQVVEALDHLRSMLCRRRQPVRQTRFYQGHVSSRHYRQAARDHKLRIMTLEHFHSRCNPGAELLAPFPAGKGAQNEIAWITVTVKML